ncbi:MAG: hypothetical protein LQ350_000543 [Teloschistes chrysophthalmus]|nr:MAG: hypothetical protein LQ350_000543 [Niorma chrysophthalma]
MLFFVFWLCCVSVSLLPVLPVTAGLALQPASSKPSSRRAAANVTSNGLSNPTPNLRLATWCHVPNADYELLYSARRTAAPLLRGNIMYVISFLRETLDILISDEGGSAPYGDNIAKITARGIGLYVWDDKLKERSLNELYNGIGVMLLCALEQNMRYEINGTLFLIEKQERFAAVAIRKVRPKEEGEGQGRNGTVAIS